MRMDRGAAFQVSFERTRQAKPSNSSVFSKLNPPPLIQEEEFM